MVRRTTRAVGFGAERWAERYLVSNDLCTVDRNFYCRFGEIDLIMLDGEQLVFVEVRFRSARRRVAARFSVDAKKRNRIVKTAAMFIASQPQYANRVMRFDIVGVDQSSDGARKLTWIKDAFRPHDSSL
jgi:putative endonuclease